MTDTISSLLTFEDTIEGRAHDLPYLSACSFVLFGVLAIAARMSLPESMAKVAYVVPSTVHAVVIAGVSVWTMINCPGLNIMGELWQMIQGGGDASVDFVSGHSRVLFYGVAFSNGYFAVDTILMFINNEATILFLIHHILGAFFFSVSVILACCEVYVAYLLATELSTPFLNLALYSKEGSGMNLLGNVLFAMMFFLVRVFPIPIYLYSLYQSLDFFASNELSSLLKYCSITTICIPPILNAVWSLEIIKKATEFLCPPKEKSS
eukprot:jgi/Bigna1/144501/aug1.88_g19209